jgi:hypothetical protein
MKSKINLLKKVLFKTVDTLVKGLTFLFIKFNDNEQHQPKVIIVLKYALITVFFQPTTHFEEILNDTF